ncbi:hypothetical protein SAY86_013251 [Trapa natans]|uniref:HSF-type DNA-binding domain-containing protein n=1 Tax=Trapa natans TaxID=22666 RepID=A0AAN7R9Y1_TRANT|nr:hypothetical protein SAY86_013251 [Trapa natans]
MDDSLGSSSSLPPFLSKTYEMVDDSTSDSIVSWSETNKSFVVWNPLEFARVLLPMYFKHNNFSSFIRQLNTYGFRKIDPEKWEFANDDFIRGQPNLLRNIHRRKPVHSHSVQNAQTKGTAPVTNSERQGLKDNIEKLKNEKESILLEVQKHEEERIQLDFQICDLKDRFHTMEQRQRSMVSNLADVLQKPGLVLTFLFETDPNDKKRRLPRIGYLQEEASGEESSMETNSNIESTEEVSFGLIPMMDLYDQLEASLTIWETILSDVCQSVDQRVNNSHNLELDEAASSAECPDIDISPELVMVASSEPPEPAPLKEKEQSMASPVRTDVNDVFWAQFLTEDPGSSDIQEVQSERMGKNKGKGSSDRSYWWSPTTVNNLAEQMGHLTPL